MVIISVVYEVFSLEFRVNYVVVGFFVLVISACALVTGLWLSAGFQSKTYDTYEILMYEPVSGLNEQAPVKFNGVQVGFVTSIDLNDLNPRQVILLVDIETGTPITTSTVATLMSQGITGVTYIGLKAKTQHAEPLKKLPGQPYRIIASVPSFLVELSSTVREIGAHVVDVANSIQRVLSVENTQAFQAILAHTSHVMKTLDTHSKHLGNIIQNTDVFTKNLAQGSKNFPDTMEQFQQTLIALDQTSTELSQFLTQGSYTLRQWSEQFVPSAFSLVYQASRLTMDLDQIASELKNQPSLLIRGKAYPPLGPGE